MVNTSFTNVTTTATQVLPPVSFTDPAGFFTLIIGAALVVIAIYIVFKVIKNFVVNAIIGGIGLIVLHFIGPMIGLNIKISLLNIIICLISGLPGLVIVVILTMLSITG